LAEPTPDGDDRDCATRLRNKRWSSHTEHGQGHDEAAPHRRRFRRSPRPSP
jgi:hypothetical protein